jgi:hypothetical protein
MSVESAFMEIVQLHERTWGMEQYPGRPSLADLLSSPIVIMWMGGETRTTTSSPIPSRRLAEAPITPTRFMMSVHQKVDELNDVLLSMVVAGKVSPNSQRRISKLFVNKKPVDITGVRLIIADH